MDKRAELLARGRTHYILWHGVVGWGVATAVFWSAGMAWWFDESFWGYLGIAIVLFPLGGYVWGAWMWRRLAHDEHRRNG